MKRKLITAVLLALAAGSRAQNNPIFYGGNGDGWKSAGHIQATTGGMYSGGNSDGWSKTGYMQGSISQNYYGGNGDGWNKSSYVQGGIALNFYGGEGDGWIRGSYIQGGLPQNFFGGNGDGFHSGTYAQNRPDINTSGGIGDGFSADNYTQASHEYAYRGGNGDGWASTYTPLTPLPLHFVKFDAFRENKTSHLNWKLGADEKIRSFDVERGSNAVSFEKIGNVAQSSAADKNYDFIDRTPVAGNNYYRLKVIYSDGKTEYTGTRVVNFEAPHSLPLRIYPNPATDVVNVELPDGFRDAQYGVVNIYGMNGAMVYQQKITGQFPSVVVISTALLAAGNYIVHVASDNNSTAQGKVVVLKQ